MYPSERPASLMIRHWTLTRMEATPKFIAYGPADRISAVDRSQPEKEMDAKIEEKVNEALAKREENEDEEES